MSSKPTYKELEKQIIDLQKVIETKLLEEQIIQQNAEYHAIFNSITDATLFVDSNRNIVRINPAFKTIFGYDLEDIEGRTTQFLYVDDDDYFQTGKTRYNTDAKQTKPVYEVEYRRKDGTVFPAETLGVPVIDSSGRTLGYFGIIRDVTERKLFEEEQKKLQGQLQQAQKMEAIGTLAGGIAHDFNNMLAAIMSSTELLGSYLPDESEEPKARKMQQMILDASRRAADLTKQLLAFSRQADKASTVINVNDIIDETLIILKSSIDRRITVELDLLAAKDTIVGDSSLLQTSLLNLCINASHAMPEGGLLKISTQEVDIDDFFCQSSLFALEPGKFIELEVRDSGCGIPMEKLPRIFEPFFTTKEEGAGTGLGLSTVYGTVQQHKGAIDVYSEVGEGTVFKILIPLSFREGNVAKVEVEVPHGTGCILIVDDEEIMRFTAKEILEQHGYTVILAENGKEAVELFCKNESMIDLVMLDMIMPLMNGRDCFKQLKRIDPHVKVVLSSGFSREVDFQEMMQAGLSGFIRKPYLTSVLCSTIHDALN